MHIKHKLDVTDPRNQCNKNNVMQRDGYMACLHELAVCVASGRCMSTALLECLARCKEGAVNKRRYREDSSDDGTCPRDIKVQVSLSVLRGQVYRTYEVMKCANDWRVSVWRIRIGEIS